MEVTATIQARMGSTRLPEKVMRSILGEPMLARQVERVQKSQLIDRIIIATSTNPNDDPVADLANELGVDCFRGSEDRVFDRIVSALRHFEVELHVELYGDCPLPDPTIFDIVIGIYLKRQSDFDYVGTGMKTTFPPGLDLTVYPAALLYDVQQHLETEEEHRYVSINIRSRQDRYRILNVEAPRWFRFPELHLEVDTAEDFQLIATIYEELYPGNPDFLLPEIISFLDSHPNLKDLNREVPRRWKQFRNEE